MIIIITIIVNAIILEKKIHLHFKTSRDAKALVKYSLGTYSSLLNYQSQSVCKFIC